MNTLDLKARRYTGGVLNDDTKVFYPAVFNREEAWQFVLENYPNRYLVRHIRATVETMPAIMSLNELPLLLMEDD